MSDIKIRNFDDNVLLSFKAQAAAQQVSLESYLRELLYDADKRRRAEAIDQARAVRESLFEKYGLLSDSVLEMRAERDPP